jgi:hypothetical protein
MFIYGRDLLSTLDPFVVGGAGSLDDNIAHFAMASPYPWPAAHDTVTNAAERVSGCVKATPGKRKAVLVVVDSQWSV